MKKPLILAALLTTVLGLSVYSVKAVDAQEDISTKTTFVQKLAQKLGLEETRVEGAVNEIRDERKAEMKTELENRLKQAVTDGKLTEAQKTSLLAMLEKKRTELSKMHEELEGLTPEERQSRKIELKATRDINPLQEWAENEGIDLSTLKEYMHPFGRGMKLGGMMYGGF